MGHRINQPSIDAIERQLAHPFPLGGINTVVTDFAYGIALLKQCDRHQRQQYRDNDDRQADPAFLGHATSSMPST